MSMNAVQTGTHNNPPNNVPLTACRLLVVTRYRWTTVWSAAYCCKNQNNPYNVITQKPFCVRSKSSEPRLNLPPCHAVWNAATGPPGGRNSRKPRQMNMPKTLTNPWMTSVQITASSPPQNV